MEISKSKQLSGIEIEKFENMVKAIGPDTIKAIANAGPQMQVGGLDFLGLPYPTLLPYHTIPYPTTIPYIITCETH